MSMSIMMTSTYADVATYEQEDAINETQSVEVIEMETPKASFEEVVDFVNEPTEIVDEESTVSEKEIELLALITMAEAGGEPADGQRLVIDVILNRVDSDRFPNTITEVIYQPNQFSPMLNGAIERCYVRDDIYQLVLEELESRTNDVVLYFRANHYHNFGTPVVQVGGHYFSTV